LRDFKSVVLKRSKSTSLSSKSGVFSRIGFSIELFLLDFEASIELLTGIFLGNLLGFFLISPVLSLLVSKLRLSTSLSDEESEDSELLELEPFF